MSEIYNYTMELWNMLDEKEKYSLRDILELKYRIDFLRKENIEVKELEKTEMINHIKEQIQDICKYDEFTEKEKDYIGNSIKKIIKMLDALIGKENRKLVFEKRNEKIYNVHDCRFFMTLLSVYNHPDSKQLRKKKYQYVQQEYLYYMYKAMLRLAENEDIKLTEEIVKERWDREFNKRMLLFINTCNESIKTIGKICETAIRLYRDDNSVKAIDEDRTGTLFDEIEFELFQCTTHLRSLREEFGDGVLVAREYDNE